MTFSALTPTAIRLKDGAVLHYVREGAGPVLIFCHGVLGDLRSWEPQWEVRPAVRKSTTVAAG